MKRYSVWIYALLVTISQLAMTAPNSALAASIALDFETNGSGGPSTSGFISPDEYLSSGVVITADEGIVPLAFRSSQVNIGTSALSGFGIRHSAVAGFQTFIDLAFSIPITSVEFDWASSTVGDSIVVSAYGNDGGLLGVFSDIANANYISSFDPSFVFMAGHFMLDLGGTAIKRLRVEDDPVGVHLIRIDNLAFDQIAVVPSPPTSWLMTSVLALLLIGYARDGKVWARTLHSYA